MISAAVDELVGLRVALVVARLAHADDDVDGRDRDPGRQAHLDVLLLAREAGELAPGLRLGDDDEPVALAEAGARRAPHDADDPVDHLARRSGPGR